jgi:hypothetical protein
MLSRRDDRFVNLASGTPVRVRLSQRAPYSGQCGIIATVDQSDNKGAYLVRFADGTQYRYQSHEIELATSSGKRVEGAIS